MIATLLVEPGGWLPRLVSFLGLFGLVAVAFLLSEDRKAIRWRPVFWGVGMQLTLGLMLLDPDLQRYFFDHIDAGVHRLLSFSEAGATFVFQSIVPHAAIGPDGQPLRDEAGAISNFVGAVSPGVKTFAFWILPSIVFFSSLTAVLYHIGLLQRVVWGLAWVMERTMGVSGAESLSTAANIFLGQTESPLVVKPYIERMTRSELHAIMVGGFASVSGGVLAAYVGFLGDIPGIAGHLVTASLLSAPATLAIAKVMVPERGQPETSGKLDAMKASPGEADRNVLEAAARGASEGMALAINVAAMLIAFIGLLAMVNWSLSLLPGSPTMTGLLAYVFAPMAFLMGIPWDQCFVAGGLLGEKIVATEFIAYIHLGQLTAQAEPVLSARSATILSYGLCGFANFASIGIQIGGIGAMAKSRTGDLAELGLRAMVAGSLASFRTGAVAGIFLG